MDNLRIHYRKEIKALAEAGGLELLYLQVHSCELNIIETFWAIIKK
jgi:transposase